MKIIQGDFQVCYVITVEGWSTPLREIPSASHFGGKATSHAARRVGKVREKNTPPFVIKDFY
jgi:hypothetical protein